VTGHQHCEQLGDQWSKPSSLRRRNAAATQTPTDPSTQNSGGSLRRRTQCMSGRGALQRRRRWTRAAASPGASPGRPGAAASARTHAALPAAPGSRLPAAGPPPPALCMATAHGMSRRAQAPQLQRRQCYIGAAARPGSAGGHPWVPHKGPVGQHPNASNVGVLPPLTPQDS
jgi:hypothetical protein